MNLRIPLLAAAVLPFFLFTPAGATTETTNILLCATSDDSSVAAANQAASGWTFSAPGAATQAKAGSYYYPVKFNSGTSATSASVASGSYMTALVLGVKVSNVARTVTVTPYDSAGTIGTPQTVAPGAAGSLVDVSFSFTAAEAVSYVTVGIAGSSSATAYLYYATVTTETPSGGNTAPMATQATKNINATVGSAVSLDLSDDFSDADGDTLNYAVESGVGAVSGSTWSFTPNASGSFSALVSATDPSGTSATMTINVTATEDGLALATLFNEGFSGANNAWSQTSAKPNDSVTDCAPWSFSVNSYNARSAVKVGGASAVGWALSPEIILSNEVASANVSLSFSAAAYPEKTTKFSVSLVNSATGETNAISSLTDLSPPALGDETSTAPWSGGTNYVEEIVAPTRFKLLFETISSAADKRLLLDSIKVTQIYDPNYAVLAVPTGVTSNNVEKFSFTVSWTGVEHASGYEVWLNDALAGSCGATSTNLTGLTAATSYKVQVRAKGDNLHYGDSPLTSPIYVTTLADAQKIDFTVTGAPTAPVVAGDPVAFTVVATNEATQTAAEVALSGIAAATFTPATGAFAWTPTESDVGDNVATFTSGAYSTNVTISVLSANVTTNLFHETFAGCDKAWIGTLTAATAADADENGWIVTNQCYQGKSGLRIGLKDAENYGFATTRPIKPTTPGTVSISFRAAGNVAGDTMIVTATGGMTFSQTITLAAYSASSDPIPDTTGYVFAFTDIPVTDDFTLTFAPASGDGRMGVDEILVQQTTPARLVTLPAPAPALGGATISSLTASWDAVADAEGYGVRLLDAATSNVVQTIASQAATSATFTGLAAYHEYVASVRALGDGTATASSPWAQSAAARTSVDVNAPVFAASEGAGDAVMATAEKRFSVTATRDGDPVAVSFAGLTLAASGATWSSPWFAWTPTDADAGSYTARFTTDNGAYSTNIAFAVTARPALADPVVTNTAVGVKNASFLWDVVPQPRAASYAVRLWRGVADYRNPVCFEDFGDGGSMPDGWSGTDTEWYTKGGYESSRVKFVKDGATLVSKLHSAPVTNLTFHTRSSSTSATSTLKLYASTGGTGEQDWSFISSQTISTGVQSESFPDSLGYRRFKWVFAKGTGTLGLGDIAAAHEGASAIFTLGTAESAVDLGTARSLDVSNLRAGRDYFLEVTVTGDDGTTTKSSVLRFATKPAHKATVFIVR